MRLRRTPETGHRGSRASPYGLSAAVVFAHNARHGAALRPSSLAGRGFRRFPPGAGDQDTRTGPGPREGGGLRPGRSGSGRIHGHSSPITTGTGCHGLSSTRASQPPGFRRRNPWHPAISSARGLLGAVGRRHDRALEANAVVSGIGSAVVETPVQDVGGDAQRKGVANPAARAVCSHVTTHRTLRSGSILTRHEILCYPGVRASRQGSVRSAEPPGVAVQDRPGWYSWMRVWEHLRQERLDPTHP